MHLQDKMGHATRIQNVSVLADCENIRAQVRSAWPGLVQKLTVSLTLRCYYTV